MEELVEYLLKNFDESTLKVINFMQKTNLLTWNMKSEQVKDGDKFINRPSPNVVETSYLRLCDESEEFNHDMMGEIFLHYLEYVLRDLRANWKFDINRLKVDLGTKCSYCNIKLKQCPMKVLAYIKKCISDEKFNENVIFDMLMKTGKEYPVNEALEKEVAEQVYVVCKEKFDLYGAEFLLATEAVNIEKEENGKLYYRYLDFEVKSISLINNLYDYFEKGEGLKGELDLNNLNISKDFSYMFDNSPVELAVYIKYLCDKNQIAAYNVFEKIYKKIGKTENVAKVAYYKEYIKKITTTIDDNEELKKALTEILTYIRNYDYNSKLPYIKFDFMVYTKNTQVLDDVVSILNKYFRTYNYLSNKNTLFVDAEMFIKRTKDSADVIYQLDRLYNDNDFLIFTNVDKAVNINEFRLGTFFTTIEKFYQRNRKSVTIFSGSKEGLEPLMKVHHNFTENIFKHVLDIEYLDCEVIKQKVYSRLNKTIKITQAVKEKLSDYIEKKYKKGLVNESDFINDICDDIIYNKFKEFTKDEVLNSKDLPEVKEVSQLDKNLEKLDNLVGISEVKYRVKEILKYVEYQKKIGEEQAVNLNMIFKGEAGTGKTTVAKILSELLYDMGILKTKTIIEVTGKDLIGEHLGQTAPKTQRVIDSAIDGILVIDEAHTIMTSKGSADYPSECIATLCNNMDTYKDRLVVIFAGYTKEMNAFKNKNQGLASRIGFEIEFEQFTIDELIEIFKLKLKEKDFELEDGAIDKIRNIIQKAKIAKNFGNARYIDNLFDKLVLTHAIEATDDNLKLITKNDIERMEKTILAKERTVDDVLKDLNSLIGLKDIKDIIDGFVSVLEFNKKVDHQNDFNLHMIFKGNAGTGKTTVARLIADIYYSLGYIKKNKVTEVQSQDLIGEWLGQTGPKTQAVIDTAIDGVLFIDEAYSLMEHKGSNASYTAECIATLLKAMEDYKGRLIVIFAGYTEEMIQFRDLNPGLKSRIGFELTFADYTTDELVEIFKKKISDYKFNVEDKAIEKVRKLLEEAKKVENFGNGRFVDNMLQKIIVEHAKRMKNENDMEKLLLITEEDITDIKPERSKNKIGF